MNFGNENVFKIGSLNDNKVEEVTPALCNDVYNQHYFV